MRRPWGWMRANSTSGVEPIRSSRLPAGRDARLAGTAAGHCRQEDDRRAIAHRCVEATAGSHVLAVDVDVHERLDRSVLVDPLGERGDTGSEILEQLADIRPRCL